MPVNVKPSNAYQYFFKMFLEGIEIPFESANIIASPSGNEANIVVGINKSIFGIKPKTYVQILYRDWIGPDSDRRWRVAFEGFFRAYSKNDDATGARSVSLVCGDFRMEIRKTPSMLVYASDKYPLGIMTHFWLSAGLTTNYRIVINNSNPADTSTAQEVDADVQKNSGASIPVENAASTETNKDNKEKTINAHSFVYGGGLNPYSRIIQNIMGLASKDGIFGKNGGDALDAFSRGLWIGAYAGSSYGSFVGSRIRPDKRFFIARNDAGQTFYLNGYLERLGSALIQGDSMFTTVEAAMMRFAAMFQARPYSCSTPPLIDAVFGVSKGVYEKIVEDNQNFGPKYMAPTCFILPPLTFSAPPNCNIVFPTMYTNINWNYDYDADITRAIYTVGNVFDTAESSQLGLRMIETPSSLFAAIGSDKLNPRPPITIEERFRGVNTMFSEMQYLVAFRAALASINLTFFSQYEKAVEDILNQKNKSLQDRVSGITTFLTSKGISQKDIKDITDTVNQAFSQNTNTGWSQKVKDEVKQDEGRPSIDEILVRHAKIKYFLSRIGTRSLSVEGCFNPYLCAGFPGVVIAEKTSGEFGTMKTMIGDVNQVKHLIHQQNGTAVTSFVLTSVRFADEPTDISDVGDPLFVEKTDPIKFRLETNGGIYPWNPDTGEAQYVIHPPDPYGLPKIPYEKSTSKYLDWQEIEDQDTEKYVYAKDLMLFDVNIKAELGSRNFMDPRYRPQNVPAYYEKLFGQNALDHFMIGSAYDANGEPYLFTYQSIHEALDVLENKDMTYEDAMIFVKRNVVSEAEYFFLVLGASAEYTAEDNKTTVLINKLKKEHVDKKINALTNLTDGYTLNANEPDPDDISGRSVYYGLSSKYIQDNPEYAHAIGVTANSGPATLGTILESSPKSPFIRERRFAVEEYLAEVKQHVRSI